MIFQIKNRFTNAVQFERELPVEIAKKEYSLQLGFVIEEAAKVGANLEGVNLTSANLAGAKCFNEELIYLQPIQFSGFQPWNIIIAGTHMKIGCELHKIEDWDKLKKSRIKLMDKRAADWWTEHKSLIMPIAKKHMAKHLIKAEESKKNAN